MRNNSLKADSLNALQISLSKELTTSAGLEDRKSVVADYLRQIDAILRHLVYDVKCVHNEHYEGFIFVAWIEQNELLTKVIEF